MSNGTNFQLLCNSKALTGFQNDENVYLAALAKHNSPLLAATEIAL